ncbi:MAG: response regulator [Candidatus Aminicenantes bacterium]|nr:response regulator [Candidatus Aminicenantes bacterium]
MKEQKIKILLVEDDVVDQQAFVRFVKKQNLSYQYKIAGSLEEAQKILDDEDFSIIISDHMLGDGSAFELFERLSGTPFILMTGQEDEEIYQKANQLGARACLVKDSEGTHLHAFKEILEEVFS